jgi:hypothetical protein
MTRTELCYASGAFALFAAVSMIWDGCCYDCDCPDLTAPPPMSRPLTLQSVSVYGDAGTISSFELDAGISMPPTTTTVMPESGSVQVTGEQVVITYRQQDQEHRVVYTVIGPEPN